MTRLAFPDEGTRQIVSSAATGPGQNLRTFGSTAVLYTAASGGAVADLRDSTGAALATAGTLTIGPGSLLPDFQGPDDSVTRVLYASIDGSTARYPVLAKTADVVTAIGNATYSAGTAPILYVSPTGNDSSSGLIVSQPKATIAAAVTALPGTGGTIVLSDGTHPLPAGVTLPKGTTITASRSAFSKTAQLGAVISVTDAAGYAFVVDSGCVIENVEVWYPNQACSVGGSPIAYPSTFRAATNAKGIKFRNLLARNPYVLFDFTQPHTCIEVDSVKGFPLNTGLNTDQAADLDRFSRIDFNPSYLGDFLGGSIITSYYDYVYKNATAYKVQRCDFTTFTACLSFGYLRGLWLTVSVDTVNRPDNVRFVACDFDASGTAVQFDYGRDIVFSGCCFVSKVWIGGLTGASSPAVNMVQTSESARFVGCRWLDCEKEALRLNGPQSVIVTGSLFRNWAADGVGTYAALNIIGNTTSGHYTRVVATGNDFAWSATGQSDAKKKGVTLDGTNAQHRAIVSGNHFYGIGNVAVQAFSGADNYIVAQNIYENCALATAFQGSPANTVTTGSLTVAS